MHRPPSCVEGDICGTNRAAGPRPAKQQAASNKQQHLRQRKQPMNSVTSHNSHILEDRILLDIIESKLEILAVPHQAR